MPHRPFYPTNLRCAKAPMLLTMGWKAKGHVVSLLQCPHTIWGAMYRFVLSLSPIYTSGINLLWSITLLLIVYIYWQGVIISHKWKYVNTFDDQIRELVNVISIVWTNEPFQTFSRELIRLSCQECLSSPLVMDFLTSFCNWCWSSAASRFRSTTDSVALG